MAGKTALIAGATGLVGTYCLSDLIVSPAYSRIVALVRRRMPLNHPKLDQRVVDFDQLQELPVSACDDIFLALGTTIKKAGSQAAFRKVDFELPRRIADASLRLGAQRAVLVSSVGAAPNSRNFYLRVKGELEQAIASMTFEAFHILRPSLLLGRRAESRFGEGIAQTIMPALGPLMLGQLKRYRAIPAETVAKAMVAAAQAALRGVHVYEFEEIKALAEPEISKFVVKDPGKK
ncbi:MAG TPA: NAD-dependent epimerase/dehydratase family protein [Terriglobales bacterium]|nr:NAD-dependent epimerase/dehydratase family protein [Terriglobales bacterium]